MELSYEGTVATFFCPLDHILTRYPSELCAFYISSSDSCARASVQLWKMKRISQSGSRDALEMLRMYSPPALCLWLASMAIIININNNNNIVITARCLWLASMASGGTGRHLNAHLSPLLCQVDTILIMIVMILVIVIMIVMILVITILMMIILLISVITPVPGR